ncbi:N-acetylmuramoyl-L-alanine amidase [Chryseobacterium aahli]|uniref:peptidoglycan recognition protein family protein n=1 Tax=Chryseobacterium aahli TaxID=1278643 RepID=UPI001F61FD37|nr:N-acetylmuramoyl-L-alanine amidase [Chryseobacterium aahli]MCI3939179.1 N-acetylmuramoyl-L-alanine amidase [Chryseobacterium aahli]
MTKYKKISWLTELQHKLDIKFGKNLYNAALIALLFGCLSLTSCGGKDAKVPNFPTHEKVETPEKPQPPIKITITDTKQTVTNNELKEIYGDTPVIKDAYFAKKVEEKDKKVTYEQIKSASIKDEVHIVVDTLNIPIGTEVKVKILEKGIINKDEYKEVSFLQDKKDVQGIFTAKIDYYDTDGDGEMLAVFTINLNNIDDKITQDWISKITSDKDKKLKLCIYVEVPSLKDKVVYCSDNMDLGEGIPKDGVWLDQPNKWFEVKTCECVSYKIENNLLNGPNVIHTKAGSKVKSTGAMQTVKAIVLHRTAGYTTISAVGHTKGTHFYVDGPRGNDGEIFQPFGLDKSSSHIRSSTDKTRIARKDIENNNSIGIEVIGLNYSKDKKGVWINQPSADKKITKGYKDYDGEHHWDELSLKQINSVVCIVKKLLEKYNLNKSDILLHEGIQQKTGGEGQAVYDAIISKL